MRNTNEGEWLTPRETAITLQRSYWQVLRLMESGEITGRRTESGRYFLLRSDVEPEVIRCVLSTHQIGFPVQEDALALQAVGDESGELVVAQFMDPALDSKGREESVQRLKDVSERHNPAHIGMLASVADSTELLKSSSHLWVLRCKAIPGRQLLLGEAHLCLWAVFQFVQPAFLRCYSFPRTVGQKQASYLAHFIR